MPGLADPSTAGVVDSRPAERRALARGGALSFAGSAGSALLGFLVVLAAARLMGDTGAGVLLQMIGIFSIVTVLAKAGLDSASLWLLPRLADEDVSAVRRHVLFILMTALTTGCLAALATGLVLPQLLALNTAQREVSESAAALSWFVPLGVLVLVTMGITRALGALVPFVVFGNLGLPLLRLIAVVLAAGLGASSVTVTLAWAAALVPILAALLWVTARQITPRRSSATHFPSARRWPTRAERRKVVGFALPRSVSAGLEQLLVWMDVLIVGVMLGPAAAGLYGAATRFIAAGLIVDAALRIVVSPRFSLLMHRADVAGTQDLYRTATRWLVLFATPGFVLLVIYAPVLLSWLGPSFSPAAPALVILGTGAMITFLAGNIHSVLLMSGHAGWAAVNKAVAVVVSVTGCALLIPVLGLTGAAVAWTAAMLIDAAMAAIQVRRLVGVQLEFAAGLGSLMISLLAVGLPAALLRWWIGTTNVALVGSVMAGGLIFLLVIYLLRGRLQLTGLRASV